MLKKRSRMDRLRAGIKWIEEFIIVYVVMLGLVFAGAY